jgi:hypothetical protein
MKAFTILIAMICLCLAGCKEAPERMLVEETRKENTKDVAPKMFATSDERFNDTKPSPVQGNPPANWLERPGDQIRLLNYGFGESGLGEVYVSISSGGVMNNANRWLKQFGADPMTAESFAAMEKISVSGVEGVWVQVEGEYGSGMGADAKPGYGLAGVIAEVDGQILTVKMIGPKNEVDAEKPALRAYIGTLRMAEN